ncbi:MAG: ATP-binding protein [Chloroflexota bacterium]
MPQKALTPEMLVPRLGEYLLDQGLIGMDELNRALAYQKEKSLQGQNFLFGEALIELGFLRKADLDQAITEQIIQFRTALENANRYLEQRVEERTSELQNALRKLAELNHLKSNFVANVSHELRTPLTHIKGYLEMISIEALGPLTGDQKNALQVCQKASNKLENLIDDLILFSQNSQGELTLKINPVDIGKLAQDVVNLTNPKALARNINLGIHIQPNLPNVQADEEKISWVMHQLLDNAIKFTEQGGQITLSIAAESGSLIMVSVSDNGIGIPEDRFEEIFEAFHQLDGSSTRVHGGTGLGLALVRTILEAHGSLIEVKSELGKGSTFKFPLLVTWASGESK